MAIKWLLPFFLIISCSGSQQDEIWEVPQKDVVFFVYHRFGDPRFPSTNIGLDEFRGHLKYLKENNYTVMNMSDAIDYLQSSEQDKKVAVITVDDGYRSFSSGAMRLLKEFKMPATLFINTETVGSKDYLNWDELKIISEEGIEIGNHTHSHAYFLDYNKEERSRFFKEDVEKAQQLIKENLGLFPEVFAYPYGEFDPEMKEVIKKSGFHAAVAQNSGVMHSGGDFFAIPRFPMSESYASGFKEKAQMKPLKVIAEEPKSTIVKDENPPVLQVTFENDSLNLAQLQCFVQGGECIVEVLQEHPLKVKVIAKSELTNRRTLYTLTVPSESGRWHWYSHLWVKTKEDQSSK